MSDLVAVRGHVHLRLIRDGKVIYEEEGDNLVVNTGRTLLLDQLSGGVTSLRPYTTRVAQYLALGSGRVAPAAGNTSLGAEEPGPNGVRKLAVVTSPTTGAYVFSALWDETANQNTTIGEVGLFTNSTSGGSDTLFARYVTQNAIPKDEFTQFQANYQITVAAI